MPGVFRWRALTLVLGVLGECVFLYFSTTLCTSGVLDDTDTLMVPLVALTRSGDETGVASDTCRGRRAGTICHRSMGAAGGCFKHIRSFIWASEDILHALLVRAQKSAEVTGFELSPVFVSFYP